MIFLWRDIEIKKENMEQDNNKNSTQRDLGDMLSETFRKISDAYNDHKNIEWTKINNEPYTMTVERISNNDWQYKDCIKNINNIEDSFVKSHKDNEELYYDIRENIERNT